MPAVPVPVACSASERPRDPGAGRAYCHSVAGATDTSDSISQWTCSSGLGSGTARPALLVVAGTSTAMGFRKVYPGIPPAAAPAPRTPGDLQWWIGPTPMDHAAVATLITGMCAARLPRSQTIATNSSHSSHVVQAAACMPKLVQPFEV